MNQTKLHNCRNKWGPSTLENLLAIILGLMIWAHFEFRHLEIENVVTGALDIELLLYRLYALPL